MNAAKNKPIPRVAVVSARFDHAERVEKALAAQAGERAMVAGTDSLAAALDGDVVVLSDALLHEFAACTEGDHPLALVVGSGERDDAFLEAERAGCAFLPAGPALVERVAAWLDGALGALGRGQGARPESVGPGFERRYENLVHALPDIVYELDPDGVIRFINESVSWLGYRPEDLVGRHFSVLLAEADVASVDRDKILPDYAGQKTGLALSPKLFNERRGIDRKTQDLEVRLCKKPGAPSYAQDIIGTVISYGEVSAAGEYAPGGEGEFLGSVGIIRDITLRRKSEDMLRKLYQAVDQLSSCIFIVNHAFDIEYVNPAFFLLTGFSPPDVIGRNIFRFFAFMPEKADSMCKHVQDGFDIREEVLVPRARGGQFWSEFALAPVRSPSGVVTHAIAVVEDISSRRSMEELLRAARSDADEAAIARTRFLASMTHELKNPINGIISAARLIGLSPEEGPAKARSILDHAQALMDLLSGILDYVRSESGDITVQRLTFPLGAFMERLCRPYADKAAAKGLAFELSPSPDEIVESDPDRLGRAVAILVDNAVKYTESGSVSVGATIERREGNVPHLRVRVCDTGVGIGAQDKDRIFMPFVQSTGGGLKPSHGAGIGLALARNIVRVLGGEISMASVPGKGSDFSLIVPAAAPVPAKPDADLRYTVLVVDDNDINLEYMRTLIENHGYRVHCADSAAEAFRVLEERYVDAAILDIQMPGFSGIELAKAIRAYAGARYSSSMPLLAMTAHSLEELKTAEPLFRQVFPKPTDIRHLLSALSEAMAEREAVSVVYFNATSSSRPAERSALIGRTRDTVESAVTALRLALKGETDMRVDVRAEAARLTNAFQRFACAPGLDLVRLFIEHYSDEDPEVLLELLDRASRMIEAGLGAASAAAGEAR